MYCNVSAENSHLFEHFFVWYQQRNCSAQYMFAFPNQYTVFPSGPGAVWFEVLSMADPVDVNYSVVEALFSQKQSSAENGAAHKKEPTTVRLSNHSMMLS